MDLDTEGRMLVDRRLKGEKLSRRDRRTMNEYLAWKTAIELQHICGTLNGVPVTEDEET